MAKELILIVDDNAANLKVARFALESESYRVVTAADAEEAIDRLHEIRPSLILMDIQLPGMDGLELTRLLKARPATKDILIVAVTAYAMMGDRERALSAGCDGYITKPLDPIRLPAQLAEYMARDTAPHSETVAAEPSLPVEPPLRDALSTRLDSDCTKQIILIVEDNPATCRMYRLSLETAGYEVIEARDGRSALEALAFVRPALIIQDLVLPDMDGMELATRIRKRAGAAPLPILCVSGFLLPVDEARARNHGFNQVLLKPLDPFHLLDAVKQHLRAAPGIEEPVGEGRLLLVADDEPLQRRLAQMWFSSAGFKVISASSGAEALELTRREHPVAVVSDVLMPEMDGFALCLNLRKDPALAAIPVILTSSAYTEKADRELATRVGATALLAKEGGLESVTRAVASALNGKPHAGPLAPDAEIEKEHGRRRAEQLDRQVVENTSLLRRTVLHQAQLAVLAGVADALAKNMLADAVLGDVLGACLDMAGVSKGALFIRKGERILELKHQIGFSEAETCRLRGRLGQPHLFSDVVNHGSVLVVPSENVSLDVAQNLLIEAGVTSLLLVPVMTGTRAAGAMLLGARSADVSDGNAREFGRVLGALMGQALTLAQAFEKLGASELRYRTLTEKANDAICILTADGVVREVNCRLTEMTGFPAEYFIGRRMSDFAALCEPSGATPGEASRRYRIPRQDGEVALLDFSDARIEIEAESVIFSIGRDVTDQVKAQAQLMVSDRMASLGTLAAGLAHEVNNPLAVVLGNLELAAEAAKKLGAADGSSMALASLRAAIGQANEAGDRIRQIVRDLKIFSRADNTGEHLRRPVDVRALLESTLRMAVNETKHRARVIESYGDTPPVHANESRLGQVFLNLIVNAAQAIEVGRADVNEIHVSTKNAPSGRVVVEIADTGHGIPPEAIRHLFTPFVTTRGAESGTGLGLSICKQIVTELGGEITVESEVGVGTVFRVFLIRSEAEPAAPVAAPIETEARRRGRVLVIDDDPFIGKTLRLMISSDHDVTVLTSAREAMNLLTEGSRFDVILCDMMMPIVSGPDFYHELEASMPEQAEKVIFLTGGVFTETARDFLDSVSSARLDKPITVRRLREEINKRIA